MSVLSGRRRWDGSGGCDNGKEEEEKEEEEEEEEEEGSIIKGVEAVPYRELL